MAETTFQKRKKMTETMGEEERWSQGLPDDIVESIAQRLYFSDYLVLRQVCPFWRAAVNRGITTRSCPPAPQLPLLLIHESYGFRSGSKRDTVDALYMEHQYSLQKSPTSFRTEILPDLCTWYCVGSVDSWLIVAVLQRFSDKNSPAVDNFLVNPLSRARVKLPSDHFNLKKTVASSPPAPTRRMQQNYSFVATLCNENRLGHVGICRPIDKSWTLIEIIDGIDYKDIEIIDQKLYVAGLGDHNKYYVLEFDILSEDDNVTRAVKLGFAATAIRMDMPPLVKKKRVMDRPIYIQINAHDGKQHRNAFYVIEERDETAPAPEPGELRDEQWVLKSEKDRVRDLLLPDLGPAILYSSLAVAKSRLFLLGGDKKPNDVFYIDLERSNPYWERSKPPPGMFLDYRLEGAAVSDDGDWIYTVGSNSVLRFHSLDVDKRNSLPPLPEDVWPSYNLLALTGSKIFLTWCHYDDPYGHLGCCDLESASFQIIDDSVLWCEDIYTPVVVRDSYLICLANCHPMTLKFLPALYVYDIGRRQWLSEPVQGLLNDGIILPPCPSYDDEDDDMVRMDDQVRMYLTSVMQVRRDELKLALVWSTQVYTWQTEVHWSKFILRINENANQDVVPTFHAESLSSGTICGPDHSRLFNIATG